MYSCIYMYMYKPLGARGILLRWLAHPVLHCTDEEAQLGRNSRLQLHSWYLFLKFHVHIDQYMCDSYMYVEGIIPITFDYFSFLCSDNYNNINFQ